jgi:3-oxoadipate enol-lactonase
MDLRPVLGGIRAPSLVVAGALDPATPPELGRHIASAVTGARFVEVAGAAHLANVEQADVVTELLASHLGA